MATEKQAAAFEYWNYESGVRQGSAVAQTIIETHPDGFDEEQCGKLADEVKQAELAALAVIPRRFRESFSAGFQVGRRSTFSGYQEKLILLACKGLKPN